MTQRAHILVLLILGFCTYARAQVLPGERTVYNETIKTFHVEQLKYPPLARQANIQGVVVVRAKLDSDGNVISTYAVSGPRLLLGISIENAKKWRFKPNSENQAIIVYDFGFDQSLCGVPDWPCTDQFTFQPPNFAVIRSGRFVCDHCPDPRQ